MRIACAVSMAAILVHGCAGVQRARTTTVHTIFVVDGTASIEPGALTAAFQSIKMQIGTMRRGDCMTILPIISSSVAIPSDECQGRSNKEPLRRRKREPVGSKDGVVSGEEGGRSVAKAALLPRGACGGS
jgi:hypothetical protein